MLEMAADALLKDKLKVMASPNNVSGLSQTNEVAYAVVVSFNHQSWLIQTVVRSALYLRHTLCVCEREINDNNSRMYTYRDVTTLKDSKLN